VEPSLNNFGIIFSVIFKTEYLPMKKIALLLCLLCSVAIFAQEEPLEAPQIGIKIPLGETVSVGDLYINFSEVIEDSRCPTGVTCIWAGSAKVKIEVSDDGMTVDHQFLTFGEDSENIIFQVNGYRVRGMTLSPYPSADDSGERAYSLLVIKEKI
jgi:hypothetical protein